MNIVEPRMIAIQVANKETFRNNYKQTVDNMIQPAVEIEPQVEAVAEPVVQENPFVNVAPSPESIDNPVSQAIVSETMPQASPAEIIENQFGTQEEELTESDLNTSPEIVENGPYKATGVPSTNSFDKETSLSEQTEDKPEIQPSLDEYIKINKKHFEDLKALNLSFMQKVAEFDEVMNSIFMDAEKSLNSIQNNKIEPSIQDQPDQQIQEVSVPNMFDAAITTPSNQKTL